MLLWSRLMLANIFVLCSLLAFYVAYACFFFASFKAPWLGLLRNAGYNLTLSLILSHFALKSNMHYDLSLSPSARFSWCFSNSPRRHWRTFHGNNRWFVRPCMHQMSFIIGLLAHGLNRSVGCYAHVYLRCFRKYSLMDVILDTKGT